MKTQDIVCPCCNQEVKHVWMISHPGTGEWLKFEGTFDEVMRDWFEGFNVPRMAIDKLDKEKPIIEDFSISYARVKKSMNFSWKNNS